MSLTGESPLVHILTSHAVAPYKDGFRVTVQRGDVGPVPISGLLTKSQAQRLAAKLAQRQCEMLGAGKNHVRREEGEG